MFARLASMALAACALNTTDAFGQVSYGGYNLGPDYGAMINQSMANMNNIVRQAEQRANQAVQQAMNDPRCKGMYQQHLQQGGRLSLQQFAYQYVATAGFTPGGADRYMASEQQNQAKEKAAFNGWMDAAQKSREAVSNWQEGYRRNQSEMGNILSGNRTYVDAQGQSFTLPYTQPGYYTDRSTGTVYHLDQFGRYHYMQNNSGWWVPLNPSR